eukprot:6186562-Pleurochrysis_carterae.AAC.1
MEIAKGANRLRAGLSTAEKTGPGLFADHCYLHRFGTGRCRHYSPRPLNAPTVQITTDTRRDCSAAHDERSSNTH